MSIFFEVSSLFDFLDNVHFMFLIQCTRSMALRSLYFQHAPGSRYKCVASNAIEAARFLIVESFYVHAMCSTIHIGMNRWWALLPYPVCSQRQFTNHIFYPEWRYCTVILTLWLSIYCILL
jgi:hypothetical protein